MTRNEFNARVASVLMDGLVSAQELDCLKSAKIENSEDIVKLLESFYLESMEKSLRLTAKLIEELDLLNSIP